jgi:hypothetical protein
MIFAARWIVSVFTLNLFILTTHAEDSSPAQKLEAAVKEYEETVEKYKRGVADYFDKREETARVKGEKKGVDLVKKERAVFEETGDLPPLAQQQAFVLAVGPARQKVNRAYAEVVKDHTRAKRDVAAEGADKQRRAFLVSSGLRYARRVPLTVVKPFDVKPEKHTVGHHPALKAKQGEFSHSITLYPPDGGFSQASYPLAGKCTALRVRVGIPEFPDTAKRPASEVTFEILGDGESLWKSKPTKELNEYQEAEVCVERVKVLTLRVHCPQSSDWCRACWLEPLIAE